MNMYQILIIQNCENLNSILHVLCSDYCCYRKFN